MPGVNATPVASSASAQKRSLSRVKPAYAYRAEALSPHATALPHAPVQRSAKAPT